MSEIPAALTPEQWALVMRHRRWHEEIQRCDGIIGDIFGPPYHFGWRPALIALANAARADDDPGKLTWMDLRLLEQCQSEAERQASPDAVWAVVDVACYCAVCDRPVSYPAAYCVAHLPAALAALLAKIAALLPPQP